MENQFENLDSSNENEPLDSTTEEDVEETSEGLKAKLAELEKVNKDLHGRATRAEQGLKKLTPAPKKEESETPKTSEEPLTLKDIRALQDVHDVDVDELTEYAKFKKIPVAEAKKLPEMQALLGTKKEFRESQEAANTGGSKKGTSKNTHEAILERAEAGQLPEDDEGIKALSEARLAQRIANIKT